MLNKTLSSFLCVQGLIPHIFVRGSCFFRLPTSCTRPARVLPASCPPPAATTHNLSTHNLSTHNLLTHNLPTHTTCSHTTCHHKTYSHTTCHHVAGVALGDMDVHSARQAWHLWHWAGSGGALGSQLTPWTPRLFAWQAWHLATSTFTLRGSCGTFGTGLALVAHTTLSHTTLSHKTLSHTTLSHTALSHTSLSHTIFYTQLCHIQLFHSSRTTLLHTQTYTLTQHCHTQLFHPTCLAPSPFLPAFPISFSHLLVITGRSWFVGLSGPLIFCPPVPSAEPKNNIEIWWNLGVRGLTTIQQGFDFIVHLRSGGKGEALHTSDLMAHI